MPGGRFGLTGIDAVTFAVLDMAEAQRFAADWGLAPAGDGVFTTVDGGEVAFVLVDESDPRRRPIGGPSGLAEVTWGVDAPDRLDALEAELGTDREVARDAEGTLRTVDDLGFGLAFRVTRRVDPAGDATLYNAPGSVTRINARAPRYDRAEPVEISHLAIGVENAWQASQFYLNRLDFRVSDRYADRGVFTRCAAEGNHHDLFLMNARTPGTQYSHLAFKVRDHHEVILGGQALDARGWGTFAGPGRHRVSSAIFWYFKTPFGGAWEYAADEDVVTEEWEPGDFEAESHIFSDWTFGLRKSDGTLQGPISQSAAVAQES